MSTSYALSIFKGVLEASPELNITQAAQAHNVPHIGDFVWHNVYQVNEYWVKIQEREKFKTTTITISLKNTECETFSQQDVGKMSKKTTEYFLKYCLLFAF